MKSKEAILSYNIHKRVTTDHFYLKVSERFVSGLPDSLFINKLGKALWVEYKIHPNTLTEIQKTMIDLLTQYNQTVWVITKFDTKKFTIYDAQNKTFTESTEPHKDISDWLLS